MSALDFLNFSDLLFNLSTRDSSKISREDAEYEFELTKNLRHDENFSEQYNRFLINYDRNIADRNRSIREEALREEALRQHAEDQATLRAIRQAQEELRVIELEERRIERLRRRDRVSRVLDDREAHEAEMVILQAESNRLAVAVESAERAADTAMRRAERATAAANRVNGS